MDDIQMSSVKQGSHITKRRAKTREKKEPEVEKKRRPMHRTCNSLISIAALLLIYY